MATQIQFLNRPSEDVCPRRKLERLLCAPISCYAALIALLAWCSPAHAQGGMMPGPGTVHSAAAGYTGPGDVSTFVFWGGLRGYSAAYSTGSNPGADVCDTATGLVCTTVNILSNGNFDVATASGLTQCVTSCLIGKLYDQTGGGKHLLPPGVTLGPRLIFSCTGLGSLPCMRFNGSTTWLESAAVTQAQPMTFTAVGKRTGSTGTFNALFGGTSSCSPGTFWENVSADFALFAGSVVNNTSVTENAWHSVVAVINNASSVLNVDNVENSGTAGTAAISAADLTLGACAGGNSFLTGDATEAGMLSGAPAAGTRTSLEANAKTYWGF